MKTQNKVDKIMKDEMKFQADKSEKSTMANDKKIVRGGQEFTASKSVAHTYEPYTYSFIVRNCIRNWASKFDLTKSSLKYSQ